MRWTVTNDKKSFALRSDSGIVLLRTQHPAIAYNCSDGNVIRTSDYDRLVKYINNMKSELRIREEFETVRNLRIVCLSRHDIKDINRYVSEGCMELHMRLNVQ